MADFSVSERQTTFEYYRVFSIPRAYVIDQIILSVAERRGQQIL
jgi:hypothetical protein